MAEHLRNLMPLSSRLRFVLWRIFPATDHIAIKLYTGDNITIRRPPSFDLEVGYEVFVRKLYSSPRPLTRDSFRLVVDVGANVGYTLIFLARWFPDANLVAFEPHPRNARQAKVNIVANRLGDRVKLHVAAAGVRRGTAYITDRSARSRITLQDGTPGLLPIEVVDFFDTIGNAQIDLLKMDCEGGEYDLVMDPRFENLKDERWLWSGILPLNTKTLTWNYCDDFATVGGISFPLMNTARVFLKTVVMATASCGGFAADGYFFAGR